MKLNLKTDYALRLLILLATRPDQQFEIETLSRIHQLPASSVMKIISELVRHGYVHSIRGRSGGVQIGREPSEIRVGDIVHAMNEPMEIVDCSSCLLVGNCRLKGVLCEAAQAFTEVLMAYRLSDLIEAPAPVLKPLLDNEDISNDPPSS
ncbi:HTH-type transcriptional repressor NsrR [Phaeobacter inhibens]|uniref:RrF2 family transcriptional regulator n=1 Tax=Phaeobacter inhibens TaxID=221822 RepID=UPI0027460630|nr:Rrf2 family transcriptional regulator [Phaeobacter inhibens]GLO72621.1 HTH-type transcriptional repressor NsrR [Phaeobacter inhibens]